MDTLQAAYRDDEDGYTSEAHTPPSQTVIDEEPADTPTTTAVATSATNHELLENNQSSVIVEGHQTASLENVSPGEIPLPGTPQAMDTDQIAQRDTLSYTSPPLETDGNEEEGPPPKNQKHLFDWPDPKPSEPEITETPPPPAAIAPPPLNENPPVPFSEAPSQPLQTTAVLDGGSAGTPTASAFAIPATKSEQLENNQSSGIKEGAMDTDQEEGPQPSEPKITAIPLSSHSESPPSAKMAAVGDDLPGDISLFGTPQAMETDHIPQGHAFDSSNPPLETDGIEEEGAGEGPPPKKLKQLSDLPEGSEPKPSKPEMMEMPPPAAKMAKKSKKKNKDVWSTTSRKGKKKTKHAFNSNNNSKGPNNGDTSIEDKVMIAPIPRFPDKNDDSPDLKICLSKVYKAEKVELSEDRLSASSTKGYRMVRATRGVAEGAWYFEIKVVHLGETGHTRLGWSTEKGDLQAPVGYDSNSYGYRDIDGNKVHKASREKYGDVGYKEGDVIGFYISLPDGGTYAPSPQRLVWHKGQRYVCAPDAKEESKVVPGSEILYFKNGICQGVAFTDLYGGCYYPAASMYTLPNEPACVVEFNFGPDFENFPEDFGERPVPRPMVEVPYQSYDGRVETGGAWNITRMAPMLKVIKEENTKIMKASEMVG